MPTDLKTDLLLVKIVIYLLQVAKMAKNSRDWCNSNLTGLILLLTQENPIKFWRTKDASNLFFFLWKQLTVLLGYAVVSERLDNFSLPN